MTRSLSLLRFQGADHQGRQEAQARHQRLQAGGRRQDRVQDQRRPERVRPGRQM